jgi:hypothetical protein
MTSDSHKRLLIGLSIAAVTFAIVAVWGWARATMNEVRAMLADGHTQMLEEARDAALVGTNTTEVADTLRCIGRFYRPPEPPVGPERHIYNLMERVRASYQRDIVRHLRQLTGDQLSDDPKVWIDKYAKPEKSSG